MKFLCFWLLIAIMIVGRPISGLYAQSPPTEVSIPENDSGTELFRAIFHQRLIRPVTEAELREYAAEDFRNLIIVELGCSDANRDSGFDTRPWSIKALRNGGSVLIASDKRTTLSGYFPDFCKIEITGYPVYTDSPSRYMRNVYCPYFQETRMTRLEELLRQVGKDLPERQLFQDLQYVVSSVPSMVRSTRSPSQLPTRIAEFGEPTFLQIGRGNFQNLTVYDSPAMAGTGSQENPYRCCVIADEDVFSNMAIWSSRPQDTVNDFRMMASKTQNGELSKRMVQWLQGPELRSRCLFVHKGKVIEKFDEVNLQMLKSMPPPQLPPLPNPLDRPTQAKISEMANGLVNEVQAGNRLNTLLGGEPGNDSRFLTLMRILIVITAVGLVFLCVSRLRRARHLPNYQPAPADPLFLGENVGMGSFEHRRLELLRMNDLRPVVREYLKLLFAERGLDPNYNDQSMPKIWSKSSKKHELQEDLEKLWQEIYLPSDKPLTFKAWLRLEEILAKIQKSARANRWRFATTGVDE